MNENLKNDDFVTSGTKAEKSCENPNDDNVHKDITMVAERRRRFSEASFSQKSLEKYSEMIEQNKNQQRIQKKKEVSFRSSFFSFDKKIYANTF